jgi:hypothetical protein
MSNSPILENPIYEPAEIAFRKDVLFNQLNKLFVLAKKTAENFQSENPDSNVDVLDLSVCILRDVMTENDESLSSHHYEKQLMPEPMV